METPKGFFLTLIFFTLTAAVWILRSVRLLSTLKHTPTVPPAGFSGSAPAAAGKVSVIIPAKNEELNIGECLRSLLNQDYPNLEIVVVNDRSTDGTEKILQSLGVAYLNAPPTTPGWTGKTSALVAGTAKATGEWLLFTDADTRHEPGSIRAVMEHVQCRNLQFLTLLPRCLTGSFIEDVIQPCAMGFTGLWFPMKKVNDPASPVYFANGQFILVHRTLYEKIGGHAAVGPEYLEDFALMKKAKAAGAPAECAFGTYVYGTRMYDSFGAIWRGWRRIFLHAFQRKPLVLLAKALSVFLFSALPFAAFFAAAFLLPATKAGCLAVAAAGSALALIIAITMAGYSLVKAKPVLAFLHPVAAFLLTCYLVDASIIAATKGKTVWR